MTTVGELVAVLRADSAQFTASMEKAQAQVEGLKSESSSFSKTASTAFIAAGAVAVTAIVKMIDATVEWARSVKQLQLTTGQTAESASALLVVGSQFGLSVTQMNTAFGLFEKNIVSGNKNIAAFGVVTRDAHGNLLPFDDLLANAADTFASLGSQTQKTAFAQLVFGRSGKALIPILKGGADALRAYMDEAQKSNLVIGQGAVDAAVNLGIAERKLGEAFHGLEVSIGTEFLPIATKVMDWFVSVVEAAGRVSPVIPAVVLGLTAIAGAGALLIRAGQGVVGAFASLFGASSAEVEASTAATDATVTLTGALTDLVAVLQGDFEAETAAAGATTALADAKAAAVAPTEALATANTDLAASTEAAGAAAGTSVGFFGGLLGMLTRVAGAAKAAAGPLGIALGAYALGSVSGTPKPSDAQAFNNALGDFLTAKQQLEQIKSGMDTSGVVSPEQAKAMIAQARAQAISLGAVGQALDYAAKHGVSYDDALAKVQKHLQGASSAQQAYAQTLKYVFSNMDASTSSIADVSGAVTLLNAGLAANTGRMQAFAAVSGQSTDAIMANLGKVVNDAKSTPQQVADAYQGALDQMKQANQAWHDSIVQTFGGAGSAMDKFANKQSVDITKAIGDLQAYTKKIHSFDSDIKTINQEFGKKAADFIQWASQQGLAQAGLVHAVATANHKNANDFIAQWGRAKSATDQLANDIQAALAPMFNKIIQWLKSVVHAIQGIPDPKISNQSVLASLKAIGYAADAAKAKIDAMNGAATPHGGNGPHPHPGGSSSNGLGHYMGGEIRRYAAGGGVDTVPAMLQPGEYVLRKAAVDRIGRSALDAMNKASGGLNATSDLWRRQAEDAATSIVALTNRSGSTPKEGMGIVRRVSQMGSNAAYIKSVAAGVGRELNAAQAHHFTRALQLLDKRTMDSGMRSDAAIQAALGKMNHLLDNTAAGSASTPASPALWRTQAFAKNVPYLPPMHTNLHEAPRHHHRGPSLRVILDRRHMDEQETYQEDYGRGY